ncbi:hypothetical protein [Streptomyces aureocirculatus]|uniref:hypothetical protein n=1 Tax=Streptomyces aureocirculatus TaxID=67275 RepID=UPI0004C70EB9|nr:hypothetical protein [Streptomyces aureocirculatus]
MARQTGGIRGGRWAGCCGAGIAFLGFVTCIALLVTALWTVGLWFRVLADENGHAYEGVLGVAVRTLWNGGGALALVAARLGTWALALTAPLWISAAVLEHRRRWDTSALHD